MASLVDEATGALGATKALAPVKVAIARAAENFMVMMWM
jgi:hypothetical protein